MPHANKADRARLSREWNLRNPDKRKAITRKFNASAKRKNSRLKFLYGITWDKYKTDYDQQAGKCAICNEFQERLHIDHDHATGAYRGLLCEMCNHGIGRFLDRPDLCEAAGEYLRKRARSIAD